MSQLAGHLEKRPAECDISQAARPRGTPRTTLGCVAYGSPPPSLPLGARSIPKNTPQNATFRRPYDRMAPLGETLGCMTARTQTLFLCRLRRPDELFHSNASLAREQLLEHIKILGELPLRVIGLIVAFDELPWSHSPTICIVNEANQSLSSNLESPR